MNIRKLFVFSFAAMVPAVVPTGAGAADPRVEMKTSMGSFTIELYPNKGLRENAGSTCETTPKAGSAMM